MTGLPAFKPLARLRPVELLAPAFEQLCLDDPGPASRSRCPQPAPSTTLEAAPAGGPLRLFWSSGDVTLAAEYDPEQRRVALVVDADGRRTRHVARRLRRPTQAPPDRLALTLTGTHLTAFTRDDGTWTARASTDLADRVDTRDERWLAGLEAGHEGPARALRAGAFGQLGLRDPRLVSYADGSPYTVGEELLLTATSAGPGFFDTAHTSVWSLHPETLALRHRADLFFRRPDRAGVYADHATHLVRITPRQGAPSRAGSGGPGWLVATSTWGDFDRRGPGMRVRVTLARSDADLTTGRHVLDTEPLDLPVDGLGSVGVWDPHLMKDPSDGSWLVGYVSARRFFDFHPAIAAGRSLGDLTLRAAATDRRATEGTTLVRVATPRASAGADSSPDGQYVWRVLASDGRDNRAPHRAAYPVFDLDLTQRGTITAPYPSNIPWPTVVHLRDGQWLMIGFDGTPAGGRSLGYGTHGDLVIARSV